jgi:hypothetical protein
VEYMKKQSLLIVCELWPRWAGVACRARKVFPWQELWHARAQPTPHNKAADRERVRLCERRAVGYEGLEAVIRSSDRIGINQDLIS